MKNNNCANTIVLGIKFAGKAIAHERYYFYFCL